MVGYNDERTCRVDAQTGQPIEPSLSVTLYPGSTMSDYETARDSRASAVEYGGPSLAAYYDAELQLVQFFGGELMVGVQLVGGDFDAAAIETFVKAQAATVAARL